MVGGRRVALALAVAVKVALFGVLLLADARPGGPAVDADVMTGRVVGYPLVALVLPAAWLAVRLRRPGVAYPAAADALLVLPFLADAASALLGAHDAIWWWDELGHLGGWALIVLAGGLLLLRTSLPRAAVAGLCVGFGATTAILWELAEFAVFLRHTPDPMLTYTDTLGDMALGLAGSALAALLVVTVLRREPGPGRRRAGEPAALEPS